jgi:hypothetical protein
VSVPTAELSASEPPPQPVAPTPERWSWFADGRFYFVVAGVALVIAALSLLIPSTPSYDPWAWLIWGREIVHFKLQTTGGPTWKPLPMLFTTVFALFGHAQPDMWLLVARAGALTAVVMVFRVALRATWWITGGAGVGATRSERVLAVAPGVLAGLIASVGLAFSGGFISDNALGYSEGFMTALVLIAAERHLDGHPRQAFVVGFFAALDRPEIWLVWGPYGLWLWWRDPEARPLVIGLFVMIPLLWFVPEKWGSGKFFRGVSRAHTPRSNSPAFASCPFCSLLKDHAWPTMLLRIKVVAAGAVGAALWVLSRGRSRSDWRSWRINGLHERGLVVLVLTGLAGLLWFVVIAILTQAGFSGNNRYLILGSALVDICGAAGWGWLAYVLARRGRPLVARAGVRLGAAGAEGAGLGVAALAFVALPNFVGNNLISIQRTHRSLVYQARLRDDVNTIIHRYGGAKKLLACGSVMTEGFQVPLVAWALDVHTRRVEASPTQTYVGANEAPNVILQARAHRHASLLPLPQTILNWERQGVAYRLVLHQRTFRLFTACRK